MKCGREIQENAVFCPECLADMARYPVKPGTVVLLPTRTAPAAAKKPAKRTLSPEERIRLLNRRVRRLRASLALAVLFCIGAVVLLLHGLDQDEIASLLPGQNYSSSVTSESTEPT